MHVSLAAGVHLMFYVSSNMTIAILLKLLSVRVCICGMGSRSAASEIHKEVLIMVLRRSSDLAESTTDFSRTSSGWIVFNVDETSSVC